MMSWKFVLVLAGLPACVAGSVLQVPDAGAGIVSLGDALAVVQPGDTILVAAGLYVEANAITVSGITIEGQGAVTLAGTAGSCSASQPPLRVENATGVVLRSLTLRGGGPAVCGGPSSLPGDGSPALVLVDSSVTLDACDVLGNQGADSVLATDSSLVIGDSVVGAAAGADYFVPIVGPLYLAPEAGNVAVHLTRSNLDVVDSQVTGGEGGDGAFAAPVLVPLAGASGGAAIQAGESGFISLSGGTITGGKGGARSTGSSGGPGGCGISGDAAASVTSDASVVLGGDAGTGGGTLAVPGDAFCGVSVPSSVTGWETLE